MGCGGKRRGKDREWKFSSLLFFLVFKPGLSTCKRVLLTHIWDGLLAITLIGRKSGMRWWFMIQFLCSHSFANEIKKIKLMCLSRARSFGSKRRKIQKEKTNGDNRKRNTNKSKYVTSVSILFHQSPGCSGHERFTSNHWSIQLKKKKN